MTPVWQDSEIKKVQELEQDILPGSYPRSIQKFVLDDQEGRTTTDEFLYGKIVAISFFYASC